MIRTPFRMPQYYITTATIGEQFGADIAGIRALFLCMAVLAAKRDARAL